MNCEFGLNLRLNAYKIKGCRSIGWIQTLITSILSISLYRFNSLQRPSADAASVCDASLELSNNTIQRPSVSP